MSKKQIVINLEDPSTELLNALGAAIDAVLTDGPFICDAVVATRELADDETLARARAELQVLGGLEFDDDAAVSRGEDPGCYIQGWAWLPDAEEE